MLKWNYNKAAYYLKSSGVYVVVFSGCWLLYQIKRTSNLINSIIPTNVLELEHMQAQYIYIDDPRFKDIFMFQHAEDLQLSVKDKPNNLSLIVTKWWKSLNRNLAFRLFALARSGDKLERKKAINSLSSLKHLKDWHYQHIAQMMDAQTAVALSRSPKTDLRFFLKPPYFDVQHTLYDVVEKLYDLLMKLNGLCGGCHPCLSQFLVKKFQAYYRDSSLFEHDLSHVGLSVSPSITWDQDFVLNCIQVIYHHSSLEEHSKVLQELFLKRNRSMLRSTNSDIADAGGLITLMNVYKLVQDNVNICSLIAKILSNLSLYPEYLEDIFKSGWIGILAAWSRHSDIRLAAPASRALANLDSDDIESEKYSQRIYPLYPLYRVPFKNMLDVIFIHGLLGGVFVTWRQRDIDTSVPLPDVNTNTEFNFSTIVDDHPSEFLKDLAKDLELREWQKIGHDFEVILHDCPVNMNYKSSGPFSCHGTDQCMQQSEKDFKLRTQCWPKDWLPEDVPNIRIIGVNYNTNLSMWTPLCPIEGVRSTIKERSKEFTRKLVRAGVGKRSIIWSCHSMGGLLVKKILVEEWKNGDKNNLLRNTKGIVFFSTPHRGSHVAALNQTTQMLVWPSIEVQELREQSPQLLKLHEDFLKMVKELEIEIISFGETKPTRVTALKVPFIFVNANSADPGVGEFFEIPQDHLSICKPANRQSFLYQKVLALIKRHVQNDVKITYFEKIAIHFSKIFCK